MDFKGIFDGYGNLVRAKLQVGEPNVEQEANRRRLICQSCPLLTKKAGVLACGHCGCPIEALIRQNKKVCKQWKK